MSSFINKLKTKYSLPILLLGSFIITLGLTVCMDKDVVLMQAFKVRTIDFALIYIGVLMFLYHQRVITSKVETRGKVIAALLSFVYSFIDVLGITYEKYDESIFEANYLCMVLIRFIGVFAISYYLVQIFFYMIKNSYVKEFLSNYRNKKAKELSTIDEKQKKPSKIRKLAKQAFDKLYRVFNFNSKTRFIFLTIFISLCFLPYFLNTLPGLIPFDGQWAMAEIIGVEPLTNHHPVFHSIFILFFVKIAYFLGGDNNLATSLYIIFQIIISSMVYAYVIEYLRKLGVRKSYRIIILAFFALWPVNGFYASTLIKDPFFAYSFLILMLYFARMLFEKDEFFKDKPSMILFIIALTFTCLFRNNGIYCVFLALPFIIFSFRKHWKYIVISYASCAILCFGWYQFMYKVMGAKPSETKEKLAIFTQGIGRAYHEHEDEIDKEDKRAILKFYWDKDVGNNYNPRFSDSDRYTLRDEYIDKYLDAYITLYFKMFKQFPKTIIDAFICENYGYYYPEVDNWRVYVNSDTSPYTVRLGIIQQEERTPFIVFMGDLVHGNKVPFVNLTCSMGLWFEMLLFLCGYCIYTKKYNNLFTMTPLLVLWLTCLAAPLYAEFRYLYPLFICMPICWLVSKRES